MEGTYQTVGYVGVCVALAGYAAFWLVEIIRSIVVRNLTRP